jgi:hypothetical protein
MSDNGNDVYAQFCESVNAAIASAAPVERARLARLIEAHSDEIVSWVMSENVAADIWRRAALVQLLMSIDHSFPVPRLRLVTP